MEKQRLFVDMDGTLARFHDQVNYLERMYEKDFFKDLEPFENMVEGVRQFIALYPDVEVYILSAKVIGEPPYCEKEKHAWMDEHLPEIPAERRIFTEMGKAKAAYIPGGLTEKDYLLDDYNKGLNQWLYDGGKAIKCHNNINQRGLGAYGGKAGSLWVGPMVHVDDKPEMIAAEIACHMGLEYDLSRVVSAYPDISLGESDEHSKQLIPRDEEGHYPGYYAVYQEIQLFGPGHPHMNPLNAIRYLDGNDSFYEVKLDGLGGYINLPDFQLRDICTNLYGDPDYKALLEHDPLELWAEVDSALQKADLPIVGQINFLGANGMVGETVTYHTVEDMKREIEESEDCGRPITVSWNIIPPKKKMHEMDYFSLEDKLYYEYDMNLDRASALAHLILTPKDQRTEEDILNLTDFWHEADPPIEEPLHEFCGMSKEEWLQYMKSDWPFKNAVKLGLDDIIKKAESVQHPSGGNSSQNSKKQGR